MLPIVALLAICFPGQQGAGLPDTVPGRRLGEMLTVMNTKDAEKIDAMVRDNFAKSALKIKPREQWAKDILAAAQSLTPISVEAVIQSSDTTIIARLKTRAATPSAIRLDLETDSPFGIVAAHLGSPAEVLNGTAPKKYSDFKTLYELVSTVTKDEKLPGMCVAMQKGTAQVEAVTVGTRNKEMPNPLRLTDRIAVGAIGKSMTATLIARLIEMKKLSWGMTLGQALDKMKMDDGYKSVTIEQLFRHKAGLPPAPMLYGDDLAKLLGKADNPTAMRKAYVTSLLSKPPVAGGTSTSDADYVVAGYLAEYVINKPYEWLMDRYVFSPMGMNTALIAPVGSDGQFGSLDEVVGHIYGDLGFVPYQPPITEMDNILAPAGHGVACSIEDLLKFAEFHMKGLAGEAKALTADSYRYLHTPSSPDETDTFGWTVNPSVSGEACHSESGTDGTFYTDLTIWPDSKLAIVAFTNAGTRRQPSPTMQVILAVRDKLGKH